jgi:telomeric repeat-binding factor 2-interacting protein 1
MMKIGILLKQHRDFRTAAKLQHTTDRLMSKAEENLIGLPSPSLKSDEPEGSPEDKIEANPDQDIDEWIDVRLRTGKARSEKQILDVLRCATMDPGLADEVLDYLA